MKSKILVVEDEWVVADRICKKLKELNYTVFAPASTGADAIKKIEEERPDLILMDIILEGKEDGIETAARIEARFGIPLIYLTAHTEQRLMERAKLTKPFSYLVKPFTDAELQCNIEIALHKHGIEKTLEEGRNRLKRALKDTINTFSEVIALKAPFAPGHHKRVAKLAAAIAGELCLTDEKMSGLELTAAVYDVGLVSLPAEILQSIEQLKDIRLALYQAYPTTGHDIIKKIEFYWPIANIILQHREHYDGSGFPLGIRGKDILIEARILAVADAVEYMTTDWSYRNALTKEQALEQLSAHSGSRYDPKVVAACLKLFREKGFQLKGG